MKTLTVYGASDDLIEVEGDVPGVDEFTAHLGEGDHVGYFDVHSAAGKFRVHAIYDGCWAFAIGLTGEDERFFIPEHRCEVGPAGSPTIPAYSMVLNMAVHDDARVIPCPYWRD